MDQKLAKFIAQTGADSALARDILAEKNWDISSALEAYSALTHTRGGDPSPSWAVNGRIVGETASRSQPEKRQARGFSAVSENAPMLSSVRSQLSRGMKIENIHQDASMNSSKKKSHRNNDTRMAPVPCRQSTNGIHPYHIETPTYTFTLPNLSHFEDDFRAFLEKDLIETASLKALEGSGHLNWWAAGGTCAKVWPLATTGDGNCLLHAASLGMWGFHDRLLMLRGALHLILTKGSRRHALWRRWRWQQTHQNKQAGLIYSEDEWRAEWENIVRLASPQPRSKPNSAEPLSEPDQIASNALPNEVVDNSEDGSDTVYESLEELHVFALAHVLKRPIIVIADTVLRDSGGEAFAPIPFGGIYLPLECSPAECHRSPLVLCYDAAHFSALVAMQDQEKSDKKLPALIPITDKEHRLLPLHFASDPGPDFTWWTDDEDNKIAAAATLDDKGRLELVARYVGLCKVASKRVKSAPLNGCFLPSLPAGRFGSHDGSFAQRPLAAIPRQVTGSTGALQNSGALQRWSPVASPKLIWSTFTRTIRRRLKSKSRSLGKEGFSTKNGCVPGVDTWLRAHARPPKLPGQCVTLDDLADNSAIVGAKLHTDAHHPFMQKMVENYLKAARERFECERAKVGQSGRPVRRERISRSFSASNVSFRCMNGDCTGQASHQTNYLCEVCFRKQKLLMESFSVAASNVGVGRTAPVTSAAPAAANNICSSKSNRAASVPFSKSGALPAVASSLPADPWRAKKADMDETVAVSVARSTFYGFSSIRRSNFGRSVSPIYTTARSKFYSVNGDSALTCGKGERSAPELTVVQPLANTADAAPVHPTVGSKGYRSVETRYGVTAITNPHGVTHYFIPSTTSASPASSTDTGTSDTCKLTDHPTLAGPTDNLATRL